MRVSFAFALSLSLSFLALAYVLSPFSSLLLSQTSLRWEQGFLPIKFTYYLDLLSSFIFFLRCVWFVMGDCGWWECCLARGICMKLVWFWLFVHPLKLNFWVSFFLIPSNKKALKVEFWGYPSCDLGPGFIPVNSISLFRMAMIDSGKIRVMRHWQLIFFI